MSGTQPLNVAIVGAGPAGVYAADILARSGLEVQIDLIERLPAPFGLVRYGVAPDHPHIKHIMAALHKVLQRGDISLIGNVEVGRDLGFEALREHYDAVVLATGSDKDAPLDIPGVELPEVHGASEFVFWYDGYPEAPRSWPLQAREVAVIGVGNVALDVARMLTKHPDDLIATEMPPNVEEGLRANAVTDVHVFGRRGPAQARFTPLELRELGRVPGVDVIVYEEDFDFDEGSEQAIGSSNQTRQVVKTLVDWTLREPDHAAPRRIHLHFFHQPHEILGEGGHVVALRTERTELVGDGTVRGTGQFVDTPVQAVYRAVGYASSGIADVPFDPARAVIPNREGRVLDDDGAPIPGIYATGWVKRGPVGLIGSTKSDAQQTVAHLLADFRAGLLQAGHGRGGHAALIAELERRGVRYTTWRGWEALDAYERELGSAVGRERIKVVDRETMTAVSRDEAHADYPR